MQDIQANVTSNVFTQTVHWDYLLNKTGESLSVLDLQPNLHHFFNHNGKVEIITNNVGPNGAQKNLPHLFVDISITCHRIEKKILTSIMMFVWYEIMLKRQRYFAIWQNTFEPCHGKTDHNIFVIVIPKDRLGARPWQTFF